MVGITRRSVALLAIAACATTAFAAEGPLDENVQVSSEVAEGNQTQGISMGKSRMSPTLLAGAAAGTTALMVLVGLFGLRVLGAKIVEAEAQTAGTKIAEELLRRTGKFTLTTPLYSAFATLTFEDGATKIIKELKQEGREAEAARIAEQFQAFLSGIPRDGAYTLPVAFDEYKVTVHLEVKNMPPQAPENPPPGATQQ
ncbi:hypothetical protein, conserved [Eimeria maxima]|uniref:Transmembrane protein n=1 Tax=Eimeria maxima TaxID=5804 RepID=U6LZ88_EIMMA|nr:hypothetical protein, conserved [Eimeria maxima]CDJ57287.1 hypothetical protein, conserved [Eimeria maxima]